ncbi:hypothetical protein Tco_0978349 [Tanacetum coccineum]|uniref:Uncharacterized protein n=1 Tax=Tanacetum coccineum TaxID=301880 RepID=A0ABQ5EN44_9ASTR
MTAKGLYKAEIVRILAGQLIMIAAMADASSESRIDDDGVLDLLSLDTSRERGLSTWYQSFDLSEVDFHDRLSKLRPLVDAYDISVSSEECECLSYKVCVLIIEYESRIDDDGVLDLLSLDMRRLKLLECLDQGTYVKKILLNFGISYKINRKELEGVSPTILKILKEMAPRDPQGHTRAVARDSKQNGDDSHTFRNGVQKYTATATVSGQVKFNDLYSARKNAMSIGETLNVRDYYAGKFAHCNDLWKTLKNMMTDKYYRPEGELLHYVRAIGMFPKESTRLIGYDDSLLKHDHMAVWMATTPKTIRDAIEFATGTKGQEN